MVCIVMGVSGCGKTTIGKIMANRLGVKFHDADDYHPENNINKMKNSISLDDEDRNPWLLNLAKHIAKWNRGKGAVLACSALKEKYRQILSGDEKEKVIFIFLEGNENVILERMKRRIEHYFPLELLESQFKALEAPLNAITVQIDNTPEEICTVIIDKLAGKGLLLPEDLMRAQNG